MTDESTRFESEKCSVILQGMIDALSIDLRSGTLRLNDAIAIIEKAKLMLLQQGLVESRQKYREGKL